MSVVVSGLTKRYRRTLAVDDLSFRVEDGRVTGFLGPNGAGKSTTMRLMLDLDRADAGVVRFDGRAYRALSRPATIVGALLDAGALHPGRTAREHLRVLAAASRIPDTRVDEVLGLVGMESVADRRAGGFSLGMRQRLGIAGSLLGDPSVVLYDEPNNGLDPEGIRWTRQLLRYLADRGTAVLVSSHLLGELEQVVDDLVVIGRGRLLLSETLAGFRERVGGSWVRVHTPDPEALRARLGATGAAVEVIDDGGLGVTGVSAAAIGEAAADAGIVLHELSPVTQSLEDAFLDVTSSDREYEARAMPARPPESLDDGGSR